MFSGRDSKTDPDGPATFFYPDFTVGSGIRLYCAVLDAIHLSPAHAFLPAFPKRKDDWPKEARGLYHRSGIHLHFVCYVQVSPCPEG